MTDQDKTVERDEAYLLQIADHACIYGIPDDHLSYMISVHKISADDPDPFRKSIDQYDR